MSAREPFPLPMAQEEGALAKRSLTLDPLWYLILFSVLTGAGMIGAALVDVALMVSVMSAGFSDALGRTTEHLSLWFGSGVMLICYWGLGVLYEKGRHARYLAYVGYVGMVLVIGSLLFPVQSAKFAEIWSSFGGADPFGGGQQSEPPHALLVFLVAINAVLYTGPGLFFVWMKGRFAHWIERCRNRSQAKKQGRMADEADEESEIMYRCASVLEALQPAQQAQIVQAALRQGLSVYAATIEIQATAVKAIRADVASTKTAKHQAEIDHGAALMCRSSLQKLSI